MSGAAAWLRCQLGCCKAPDRRPRTGRNRKRHSQARGSHRAPDPNRSAAPQTHHHRAEGLCHMGPDGMTCSFRHPCRQPSGHTTYTKFRTDPCPAAISPGGATLHGIAPDRLVDGPTSPALSAGVVMPLPLAAGERFAAAGADAGPVFDGGLFRGGVVGVYEGAGFLADTGECGGGDGGGLEVAACPGVAAVAVGPIILGSVWRR